ncbi:hypothetical protein [Deinococcus sp.]|uniref:hypothetical protein n=1 Tax=Deinococcus sp. TaxID=47478 RepID=UPI0025E4C565|nr:hypothetical protein [Deinococcus sp.]
MAGRQGGLFPLLLGALAARFGLGAAMWGLLLGPVSLLWGLPRAGPERRERRP